MTSCAMFTYVLHITMYIESLKDCFYDFQCSWKWPTSPARNRLRAGHGLAHEFRRRLVNPVDDGQRRHRGELLRRTPRCINIRILVATPQDPNQLQTCDGGRPPLLPRPLPHRGRRRCRWRSRRRLRHRRRDLLRARRVPHRLHLPGCEGQTRLRIQSLASL